jgi:signal transduction histidine kinase
LQAHAQAGTSGTDPGESLDLVGRIQQAQQGLTRHFEDVRHYSSPIRLERGRCHLGEVWREAWEQVRSTQPDREACLREDTGDTNLWCIADRFRLGQVFRNILENACAACEEPVQVDIFCREGNIEGRPALRVVIRDNGPGLNAEQRQRIFEPFFTTKTKGSGLGMAIARRVVEAHGGQIAAGDPPPGEAGRSPGAEILLLLPRDER